MERCSRHTKYARGAMCQQCFVAGGRWPLPGAVDAYLPCAYHRHPRFLSGYAQSRRSDKTHSYGSPVLLCQRCRERCSSESDRSRPDRLLAVQSDELPYRTLVLRKSRHAFSVHDDGPRRDRQVVATASGFENHTMDMRIPGPEPRNLTFRGNWKRLLSFPWPGAVFKSSELPLPPVRVSTLSGRIWPGRFAGTARPVHPSATPGS